MKKTFIIFILVIIIIVGVMIFLGNLKSHIYTKGSGAFGEVSEPATCIGYSKFVTQTPDSPQIRRCYGVLLR